MVDTLTVQRVMTRIGQWKLCDGQWQIDRGGRPLPDPLYRCSGCSVTSYNPTAIIHGTPTFHCPDPNDPAIIIAMLEWAYSRGFRVASAKVSNGGYAVMMRCLSGPAAKTQAQSLEQLSLASALIEAIDALPE